jgi:NAD-dependent dihydropyrimidine dehydrogenase PreA subunit
MRGNALSKKLKKRGIETMSEVEAVYHELAAKMKRPDSKILPKLLRSLASLQQAAIMREMPARPEEIAERTGLPQETVDKDIRELFEKGVVVFTKKGWNLHGHWFTMHDLAGNSLPKYDNDEFCNLMQEMLNESLEILGESWKDVKEPHMMQVQRVVPDWKAIKDIPGVLPCEDTRVAFKDTPPIVLIHCACKRLDLNRECKDDIPLNICFVAGRQGKQTLRRGNGVEISYEQYLEIQDRAAREYGLIHLFSNNNSPHPEGLCNCHHCCCAHFIVTKYTKPRFNVQSFAKSRFIAEVDPEKCLGCRTCVDTRCPVGAVQLIHDQKTDKKYSVVNAEECIGCGLCVLTCKGGASKMKLVRPPEHIPEPFGLMDVTSLSSEELAKQGRTFLP